MGVLITGQHIALHIEVRLLQFNVHYFYFVILVLFLWRRLVNGVLAKIEGLEHVGLIEVRVLSVMLARFINLGIFNHFFYLYNTFPLFKSVCPLTLCFVSRRSKHQFTSESNYSYKF